MSAFNGSGTFVITGTGLPFVTSTTISSTVANQLNTDLATGLTNCITKDGQSTTTAIVPFGSLGLSSDFVLFPATQAPSANPNALDDYEEGTFTPTLTFGGGSTGLTYGIQVGSYTKIGNRVFYYVQVTLTAKGSSTGTALISGLPVAASSANQPAAAVFASNLTAAVACPMAIVNAGAATIGCYSFTGGIAAPMADTVFNNNANLILSGQYAV